MGCVYHPHRDSVVLCDHCRADLCDGCVVRDEDGRSLCHRCMLALSLEHVKSETTIREQAEADELVGLEEHWRPTYIQTVVTIGAVLVLVLAGLWIYWSQTEPRPRITLDSTDPVELLAGLQAALVQYGVAHGNSYPGSLYDLLPSFLADTWENRRVLRYLEYDLDKRQGYRLRIKPDSPIPRGNLVATAKDIHPVREQEGSP